MSYDNLSIVSQNVLKCYQQLTGEERRIPFNFDDFHSCRSRVNLSTDRRTDGHGETSIPPYNFVAGGITRIMVLVFLKVALNTIAITLILTNAWLFFY
jgi:hypothetical protein